MSYAHNLKALSNIENAVYRYPPQPCPTCGSCPTCGHRTQPVQPIHPYPIHPYPTTEDIHSLIEQMAHLHREQQKHGVGALQGRVPTNPNKENDKDA